MNKINGPLSFSLRSSALSGVAPFLLTKNMILGLGKSLPGLAGLIPSLAISTTGASSLYIMFKDPESLKQFEEDIDLTIAELGILLQ